MGKLDRDGRVIVAEGGSCPSLERLSNGDLLVAYRDDTHSKMCVSVTRPTDCGRTWRKEHTFAYADDERILVVHHNQPPPAVGERDIEGVFYVERDEEPGWRGDVG